MLNATLLSEDPRLEEVLGSRSIADGIVALERLMTGCIWSEGPVWLPQDGSVIFSDIPNNRMMRWSPASGGQVFQDKVDFTNGHTLDAEGNLLHCSHGARAILKTTWGTTTTIRADAPTAVLVDRYLGKRLNSPNDLVVKSDGSIWFTDPPYGILSDREGHKADPEQAANHVFRFDPKTLSIQAVTDWVSEPNGLAFSPDESLLYVSDTSAALKENGNHHIAVFNVLGGSTLANPRIFAVIEPGLADGFRVDCRGWIYTSSEDSIQIYHPDGHRLGKIMIPEKVGNLCFGGHDGNEIFICASSSLYRIRTASSLLQLKSGADCGK